MYEYVNETLIPNLVKREKDETGDNDETRESVLKKYCIKSLCIRTIYNWMEYLGFKYSTRQKTYYIDGHERPENVKYQKEYIQRYLKNEHCCFRWIQMPIDKVEELERNDVFFKKEIGYRYVKDACTFFEFHVDDHPKFQEKCKYLQFGGHLSVRKREDELPLILIGQDKSILKQYAITPKQWTLPDGATSTNPKEDGQGVMLSSFVSRDFGYSHNLSQTELNEVNEYRKGKNYLDIEAAEYVHGKKEKKPYRIPIC